MHAMRTACSGIIERQAGLLFLGLRYEVRPQGEGEGGGRCEGEVDHESMAMRASMLK